MHRIDTEGSKDGRFFEGTSNTEVDEATVLGADWLNSLQDEIVNVIGEGNLSKEKNNQLTKAINKKIEDAMQKPISLLSKLIAQNEQLNDKIDTVSNEAELRHEMVYKYFSKVVEGINIILNIPKYSHKSINLEVN